MAAGAKINSEHLDRIATELLVETVCQDYDVRSVQPRKFDEYLKVTHQVRPFCDICNLSTKQKLTKQLRFL